MSSRELEDFREEVVYAIKEIARSSDLVADIQAEIREDRKIEDLANTVIRDIFEDADKDDQLYGNRDNFNANVVEEATYAVLGMIADDIFDKRDWDDMGDKVYKTLMTGIAIYDDALARLDSNNYGGSSRRSRGARGRNDRDSGRSRNRDGGRRDRGGRDRDRDGGRRTERSSRPSRQSRSPSSTDKPSNRPARPYNSGANRRDREGSKRDESLSPETIRGWTSEFMDELKDTGITDMAKLFGQMTDANLTIEDMLEYRKDRRDFEKFKANKRAILDYLEELDKPKFGGVVKGTGAGLVLDSDRILVNGEVKPVEHYMEHELSPEGRQANLARYGMERPRVVRVPANQEEEARFRETTKLVFAHADPIVLDKQYSELVDYNDVISAVVESDPAGDVVFGEVSHHHTAVIPFDAITDLLPYENNLYIAPRNWAELHQLMQRVVDKYNVAADSNEEKESPAPSLTRMISMLDDSATDYLNQCLALAGVDVSVENFYMDYQDAMKYVNNQSRVIQRDFFDLMKETFRDMFNMSIEHIDDGMTLSYRFVVGRRTPVLYTKAPVFGKDTLLTNYGYNLLTSAHAADVYEMVDSALRLRTNRAELVLVDQYDNRYAVNCARVGAGMPIIVREL